MMTEGVFFWTALGAYVASTVAFMIDLAFSKPAARRPAIGFAVFGAVAHAVAMLIRWQAVGHGPYISTYEILSSTAWSAVVLFLVVQLRTRTLIHFGAGVMPLAFVMMGLALIGSTEGKALPPSLRSIWLIVHVIFAKLTIASLLIATAFAGFRLRLKEATEQRRSKLLARLPSMELIDEYSYRIVAFGFIAITIMIITGAIWANNAWGSYWSWDPTQTWSLIVWLVYGIFLHGRYTFRWSGRVCAVYVISAFIFSLVTFFVLPYFIEGLHAKYMMG